MEFGAVFIWRYLDEYLFTLPHCQDHLLAFHRHTYLVYLPRLSLCAMFSCNMMPVNACSDQMSSLLVDLGVLSAEFGKASFGMMIRRDDCQASGYENIYPERMYLWEPNLPLLLLLAGGF